MAKQDIVGDEILVATFLLGQALFGVDTSQIQEVVRVGEITPVHHAPNYVAGIRNLRGRIVTVIDLRTRLDLGKIEYSSETRILIVECQNEPVGLLVDQVAETVAVDVNSIQPPPSNVNGVQSHNLRGVCRATDRLVAVLNLEPVLNTQEISVANNQPVTGRS